MKCSKKQGTDARLFYNAATYRCVLLAFVLATLFCSGRLRCAARKLPSGDAVELGPRGENPMSEPHANPMNLSVRCPWVNISNPCTYAGGLVPHHSVSSHACSMA